MGTELLLATVPEIPNTAPRPQEGDPTYAEKLTVEEFELDPNAPATELVRTVRAGNPRPGAWILVDGKRLKVWRAHVEDDRFVPDEVQPEGKRPMPYDAWRTGHRGAAPFA
jgi:methionyl-tRNA formyltransferase